MGPYLPRGGLVVDSSVTLSLPLEANKPGDSFLMMSRSLGHHRIVETLGEGGWVWSIALQMRGLMATLT